MLGAGAAGLMAARVLAASGAHVAVLEARSRLGGRIVTEHAPMPIELGAEFVHGLPGISWNLFREAGLDVQERRGVHMRFTNGALKDANNGPDGFSLIERMQRWYDAQPAGSDVSFAQFLVGVTVDEQARQAAIAYVEGFNAARADRISVAALVEQQRAEDAIAGDRVFHLTSGYDALPGYLANRLQQSGSTIHRGCVIHQVDWQPGAVRCRGIAVDGRAFEFTARQAVVTLPLGVLQSGSVHFTPAPGPMLNLAGELVMGAAMRYTLVFREPFWRNAASDLSFLFAPGQTPPTWWTPAPEPWPAITGWIGGPRVYASRESWLDRGLATLATVFNLPIKHLRQLLVGAHHHDWLSDRFSCGAYSYVPVGALGASRRMTLPVEQTLFFAGEHTDTAAEWGTVHGALRSGMRAATQILQSAA